MIEVNTQTIVFFQSLLLGFCLGLFYDAFRIFRLAISHSSAIIFLEDIFYFGICAVVTFLFSLSALNGHVRVFLGVGELLGATIYYFSLGALVMKVSKKIILFIKAMISLFYRVLIRPFVRVFRWIFKRISRISSKFSNKAKKIRIKAKYSLKQRSILVYNLYIKKSLSSKNKRDIKRGGTPSA